VKAFSRAQAGSNSQRHSTRSCSMLLTRHSGSGRLHDSTAKLWRYSCTCINQVTILQASRGCCPTSRKAHHQMSTHCILRHAPEAPPQHQGDLQRKARAPGNLPYCACCVIECPLHCRHVMAIYGMKARHQTCQAGIVQRHRVPAVPLVDIHSLVPSQVLHPLDIPHTAGLHHCMSPTDATGWTA
jgi:hypothetical protein